MPREILVDWTTASGGGKVSVFHMASLDPVGPQRAAIAAFCNSLESFLSSGTTWAVRTEGRDLDSGTGTLTALWSDTTAHNGVGAASSTAVSDASQVLIRWFTDSIVNGRLVRGRTFIPGASVATAGNGNPGAGVLSVGGTAAETLAGFVGFQIWHRPVNGAGGSAHQVTGSSVWTEYGILRRRRG